MSFFLRIRGVPVECTSVSEARKLLDAYGALLRVPPVRETPPSAPTITYR